MDASEDQTGRQEFTASPTENLNPGILLSSGHLCSTVTFRMEQPNECFNSINHGDYLGELREVSTGSRVFNGDIIDPWIFERQLKTTASVGKALLYTESRLWRRHERGKLKSAVRLCLMDYNKQWAKIRLEQFQKFFANNRSYKGQYMGIYASQITWLGSIPFPPDSFLLPAYSDTKIEVTFEKHLDLIVEWCMCCFSHRKNDWTLTEIQFSGKEELVEEAYVPKVSTGNKPPPDPQKIRAKKIAQANRRILNRKMSKGAVPEIVVEQLEIEEHYRNDK